VAAYKVADLLITPRASGYARGQEQVEQILRSAFDILVDQGYKAVTLRRIAAACSMNVGNISHYFKSKNELVRSLLEALMSSYEATFNTAISESGPLPEQHLETLITLVLEDITTKKTTRIFPELWALSNHDPFIQGRVDEAYAIARSYFVKAIKQLNPALPDDECELVALFITASLEGMTIFAGFEKRWLPAMPVIQSLARTCFVDLVKNLKPGEAAALVAAGSNT